MNRRMFGFALAALLGLLTAPALLAEPQSQPAGKLVVTYFYLPG